MNANKSYRENPASIMAFVPVMLLDLTKVMT